MVGRGLWQVLVLDSSLCKSVRLAGPCELYPLVPGGRFREHGPCHLAAVGAGGGGAYSSMSLPQGLVAEIVDSASNKKLATTYNQLLVEVLMVSYRWFWLGEI